MAKNWWVERFKKRKKNVNMICNKRKEKKGQMLGAAAAADWIKIAEEE